MKEFIEMLRKFDTVFTVINEEEIAIPVVAIAATEEQGELLPQDLYQENPLLADEMQVHLTFRDGRIDWAIISEIGED
jgi:hypothetical protein